MNKNKLGLVMVGVIASGVLFASFSSLAFASTPVLSAIYTGSGDNVQLNISNADPNYGVLLLNGSNLRSLGGPTNSSGSFTITISTAQYNISPGSVVAVVIDNQTSNSIQWPYTSGSSAFSLSQTNLSITVGQSVIVTASNSGPFFVSSNSNSSIASVSINSNQITVTGLAAGTTNANICLTSNASNCLPLVITVTGASSQAIYFSQNNLNISSGQTATVSVSGGTGFYSISGNSNAASVQASISGSTVNLYGLAAGSAAITVCSSNTNYCGIINATVLNNSSLIFSPANPTLTLGQATTISITGGLAPYFISSNQNNNIVQASLSNSILTVSAIGSGTATINVCSNNNICGSEVITVNSTASTGITFSQNNISLPIGQSSNVAIYGSGSSYYVSGNSSPSIAPATINGSNLIVTGSLSGTDNITVCSNTGQCGTLYITVSPSQSTNSNSTIYLTQTLSVGQSINLLVSGGTAPYSLTSNQNTVFNASISGNQITIIGLVAGSSSFNVCSSNNSCMVVYVNVSSATQTTTNNTTESATPSAQYVFNSFLKYGMSSNAVTQLQEALKSKGYYSGPITGYYGDLTTAAVKKFQLENGIAMVGYVGPTTRAALNK